MKHIILILTIFLVSCSKETGNTNNSKENSNSKTETTDNKKFNIEEWGDDLEKMVNNFSHNLENSGLSGTKMSTTKNNVVRKMASSQTFEVEDGQITGDILPGSKIQLYEKRDGREIKAIVMIKPSGNLFHIVDDTTHMVKEYYDTPELWFADFLKFFNDKDTKHSNLKNKTVSQVLKLLEEKPMDSDKAKGIKSLLDRELTDDEQVKIAEFIFDEISLDSDKTDLIVKLIGIENFSKSAKKYIVSHLDEISMFSNKEKISKLLLEKD